LKASQFPILGLLWGALLLIYSWLDPVIGLAVSFCSFVGGFAALVISFSIFYFNRSTTPIPFWNFLTSNFAAACAVSLTVFVLVCCGASAGLLEIEIMPIPN
jgi:hypothetical protein